MSERSASDERLEIPPAVAVQQLDLLGGFAASACAAQRMSERSRIASRPSILAMTSSARSWRPDVGQRARLEQQPLVAQLVVDIRPCGSRAASPAPGRACGSSDRSPASRVATCARAAPCRRWSTWCCKQLGGLIEQVDRDQPVGQPADHLVAAPADRGQVAEIVEQAERVDRRTAHRPCRPGTGCRRSSAASSWMPRVISEFGCAVSAIRMTWKASR